MFGFRAAAVLDGAALQLLNEVVWNIADEQLSHTELIADAITLGKDQRAAIWVGASDANAAVRRLSQP